MRPRVPAPEKYSSAFKQKKEQTFFLLLLFRPNDFSSEGFNDWAFMTTHSWDEDPQGEWTLEIENVAPNGHDYGKSTHHR